MTTYICGGSNSLLKLGWQSHLPKDQPFTNISVGASCCAMGAYSSMFSTTLKHGDTLIWEYALNDIGQLQTGNVKLNMVLRFCEYTIRNCMARNVRFIPLIFQPLFQEQQDGDSVYLRKLYKLFAHYNLQYLDISSEFRQHLNVAKIPTEHFADEPHYALDSEILPFIAAKTTAFVQKGGNVPKSVEPCIIPANTELRFLDQFEHGESEVFRNSIFRARVWKPANTNPATLSTKPFDSSGKVSCLILLNAPSPFGGFLRVKLGQTSFRMSGNHGFPTSGRPLLRALALPGKKYKTLAFRKGDRMQFHWAKLQEEGMGHDSQDAAAFLQARVVGALVEVSAKNT